MSKKNLLEKVQPFPRDSVEIKVCAVYAKSNRSSRFLFRFYAQFLLLLRQELIERVAHVGSRIADFCSMSPLLVYLFVDAQEKLR